ncbi:hypothetical protein SUDANB178_04955 [Streptomyces sp. enrichment culture]
MNDVSIIAEELRQLFQATLVLFSLPANSLLAGKTSLLGHSNPTVDLNCVRREQKQLLAAFRLLQHVGRIAEFFDRHSYPSPHAVFARMRVQAPSPCHDGFPHLQPWRSGLTACQPGRRATWAVAQTGLPSTAARSRGGRPRLAQDVQPVRPTRLREGSGCVGHGGSILTCRTGDTLGSHLDASLNRRTGACVLTPASIPRLPIAARRCQERHRHHVLPSIVLIVRAVGRRGLADLLDLPLDPPQVLLQVHGHHAVDGDFQRVREQLRAPLSGPLVRPRAPTAVGSTYTPGRPRPYPVRAAPAAKTAGTRPPATPFSVRGSPLPGTVRRQAAFTWSRRRGCRTTAAPRRGLLRPVHAGHLLLAVVLTLGRLPPSPPGSVRTTGCCRRVAPPMPPGW